MTTLLVANRGEIACRVMRTARRLGYRTVAVYSDADARAPFVALADEAVRIGPPPAAESYLVIDALIAAARQAGATFVHPGYGFLSERAEFAEACEAAGLVFVGPPAAAIRAMGDKAAAKRRMQQAGVPCAPGYLGDDDRPETLAAEAARIGTPLLVKAVAGGGGRGMRRVDDLAALPEAVAAARREAESAFGDGRLMLEALIEGARHVEVQVFADAHGHCLHLGERDCTAQRRRQKVIEEAPSPIVGPAMRERLGADAVAAARAVGYRGAGTVEFVVDARGQHHFLEMNTRLQVEHPVTECITGLDLVEWQLRVARGEPLPLAQEQIRFTGHAIEARLVAEDPYEHWKPQAGRVLGWRPEAAAGLARIDDGIAEGGEVPPYYDAMVAKVIAHGSTRSDALQRLARALETVPLIGVANNGRFLRDLLQHPRFTAATMTTSLLDEWASAHDEVLFRPPAVPDLAWQLAAAWRASSDGFEVPYRPAGVAQCDLTLRCRGESRTLRAPPAGLQLTAFDGHRLHYRHAGAEGRVPARREQGRVHLVFDGATFVFDEPSPYPQAAGAAQPGRLRAPVAGVVAQVRVQPGDAVQAGQRLVCVEAMKMEMWLEAATAGTVRAVNATLRAPVAAGAVLVEMDTTT
jgi:geranyl-CoA carboxylase alpha subunit